MKGKEAEWRGQGAKKGTGNKGENIHEWEKTGGAHDRHDACYRNDERNKRI